MAARKGLLAEALGRGVVDLVGINEVKFRAFNQRVTDQAPTLGVRGLGACSVVIVVSELAVILAHVGPNILGSKESDSFLRLASSKMDTLENLYNQHRASFADGTNAYVIFATLGNTPTSPEQVTIFRERLRRLDLPIAKTGVYERSASSFIDENRPEGTVWVVKRNDSPTLVYLEDKLISPRSGTPSSREQSVQGPSTPAVQASASRSGSSQTMYWARRQGEDQCKLLNSAGGVVQQTREIPKGVWIHLYSQSGVHQEVAMWNGSEWKRRGE